MRALRGNEAVLHPAGGRGAVCMWSLIPSKAEFSRAEGGLSRERWGEGGIVSLQSRGSG